MKNLETSLVPVVVRMPKSLNRRIEALARVRKIPLNDLIVIWLESQADEKYAELIGASHS